MITNLSSKRIRRTLEPEGKSWDDAALSGKTWAELHVSQDLIFAMENIFFFPQPTDVQASCIPVLTQSGRSALVEAPTGSGKTLAFLVPIAERIIQVCDALVEKRSIPFMTRNISAVIVSPNAVLSQQTCAVARSLVCRFKYNIKVELCDGSREKAEATLEKMERGGRGASKIFVTTPNDLMKFVLALKQKQEQEEGNAVVGQKRKRREDQKENDNDAVFNSHQVQFSPLSMPTDEGKARQLPFLLIVDEADVCLQSRPKREKILEFIHYLKAECHVENVDVGLFGATVQSNAHPIDFWKEIEKRQELPAEKNGRSAQLEVKSKSKQRRSLLVEITLGSDESFISQLRNCYLLVSPVALLEAFIHILNVHKKKKHFVFFNSFEVLLFVKELLEELSSKGGTVAHPIFQIDAIYGFHEGQKDVTRMAQYNNFLAHSSDPKHKNVNATAGDSKMGATNAGNGAVLLCTEMAAFGLDIRDVDYVHHFEPPSSPSAFIHRIGRVARMGMKGTSILFVPTINKMQRYPMVRMKKHNITMNEEEGIEKTTNKKRGKKDGKQRQMDGDLHSPNIDADVQVEGKTEQSENDDEITEFLQEIEKQCPSQHMEEMRVPNACAPLTSSLQHIVQAGEHLKARAQAAALMMAPHDGNTIVPSDVAMQIVGLSA